MTEGLDTDRRHHPATYRCTITGVNINMLAVEAARAVIGKPITNDMERALGATEILSTFLKTLGRERFIHSLQYITPPMPRVC